MNVTPRHKLVEVVRYLLAGSSGRGAARATGVSRGTLTDIQRRLRSGELHDIEVDARAAEPPSVIRTRTSVRGDVRGPTGKIMRDMDSCEEVADQQTVFYSAANIEAPVLRGGSSDLARLRAVLERFREEAAKPDAAAGPLISALHEHTAKMMLDVMPLSFLVDRRTE